MNHAIKYPNKKRCIMNTHEHLISQDRQKITFRGSAYPNQSSQRCITAAHAEAVHCQFWLSAYLFIWCICGLLSLSLTINGSWIPWEKVTEPLCSSLTPIPPPPLWKARRCYAKSLSCKVLFFFLSPLSAFSICPSKCTIITSRLASSTKTKFI